VVPPAYYAQLAADRGQILAQGRELLAEDGAAAAAATGRTSSGAEGAAAVSGEESVGSAAAPGVNVRANVRLADSMYYVLWCSCNGFALLLCRVLVLCKLLLAAAAN